MAFRSGGTRRDARDSSMPGPGTVPRSERRGGKVSDLQIKVSRNGPYLVKGDLQLVDADGHGYQLDGVVIALCRCGASTTKPFCDGSHSRIGFRAAERAVPQ